MERLKQGNKDKKRIFLNMIKAGKENAIQKKVVKITLDLDERNTQSVINNARLETCIINDLDGKGYYIPTEKEIENLKKYIETENKTIKTRSIALNTAKKKLRELETKELLQSLGIEKL